MSKTITVALTHMGEIKEGTSASGRAWKRRNVKVTTDDGNEHWFTLWGDMVDQAFYDAARYDGPWTLEYEIQVKRFTPAQQ